jgi:hypothetical protein
MGGVGTVGYQTRLDEMLSIVREAAETTKTEANSGGKPYDEDRFKEVIDNLKSYCTSIDELLLKGLEILDTDSTSAPTQEEWIEYFYVSVGSQPYKNKCFGRRDGDPKPLLEALEKIQKYENKFFIYLTAIHMAYYIRRSWQYRREYKEMSDQLDKCWDTIIGEMRSHGSDLQKVAREVELVISKFNQTIGTRYFEIHDAIDPRLRGGQLGEWRAKVRDAAGYVAEVLQKLKEQCNIAEEKYYRQRTVMEIYNYAIEGTRDLIITYNEDKAKSEFEEETNHWPRYTELKDFVDYSKDVLAKAAEEFLRFKEDYNQFQNNYRGIFIDYIRDDTYSKVLNLEDRVSNWWLIDKQINNERFLEKVNDIAVWADKIIKDCGSYWAHDDRQRLEDELRSEIGSLYSKAKEINQELLDRIKLYLYDVFNDRSLGRSLIKVLKF